MSKILSLKKDYEREGFHLQRLYKRRELATDGRMHSTAWKYVEPRSSYTSLSYVSKGNIGTTSNTGSSSSSDSSCNCEEEINNVVTYVDSALTWTDLEESNDGD